MRTAVRSTGTSGAHCPECSSPAGPDEPYCRCCGIWLAGPQAGELRWIAGGLRRVDEARTWLIRRRAVLLGELAGLPRHVPAPGCARAAGEAEAQVSQPPEVSVREPATPPVRRPEMSGRTAARLLLGAGAALVVIAVTIFTVAGWALIGPLGRSAILVGTTALVLAAPRPLIRRKLNATAEAVAAIGLALTIGDADLLRRLITAPAGLLSASWSVVCGRRPRHLPRSGGGHGRRMAAEGARQPGRRRSRPAARRGPGRSGRLGRGDRLLGRRRRAACPGTRADRMGCARPERGARRSRSADRRHDVGVGARRAGSDPRRARLPDGGLCMLRLACPAGWHPGGGRLPDRSRGVRAGLVRGSGRRPAELAGGTRGAGSRGLRPGRRSQVRARGRRRSAGDDRPRDRDHRLAGDGGRRGPMPAAAGDGLARAGGRREHPPGWVPGGGPPA